MGTWIYLIKDNDTGYYKIGQSIKPLERFKQIKKQDTKLPRPNNFELVNAWYGECRDEKQLHIKFAKQRVRGEWFRISEADYKYIRQYFLTTRSLYRDELDDMRDEMVELIENQLWATSPNGQSEILDFAVEALGYEF